MNQITFTLLTISLLLASLKIKAQDIITKSDGTKVQAKILEMNATEVKYKRFDYIDGPTFSLAVSEINYIKYPNGKTETFKKQNSTLVSAQQKSTTQNSGISQNGFTNKVEAKNLLIKGLKQGKWIEYINSKNKITTKDSATYYQLTVYKDNMTQGILRRFFLSDKLEAEIPYAYGNINGVEKSYYQSGQLHREDSYKDGKRDGTTKVYASNGILTLEGVFLDDKQNGIFKFYGETGQLTSEDSYLSGKKNGVFKSYGDNGQLTSEYSYLLDKKNGAWKNYEDNGQLRDESNWVDDKRNGMSKNYHKGELWFETPFTDGKKNGIEKHYHKGELTDETPYTDDKENGIAKHYYNGQIFTETAYVNGIENGIKKDYYNGKVNMETPYTDGKINGIQKTYNTNGTVDSETAYADDKKNGADKIYNPNGTVMSETNYKNGKEDGAAKMYNGKGQITSKTEYKDGVKGKNKSFIASRIISEVLLGSAQGLAESEKTKNNIAESSAITTSSATSSGKDGNSPEGIACGKEAEDSWKQSSQYITWDNSKNDITAPQQTYAEFAKGRHAEILLEHCSQYLSEQEKGFLRATMESCYKTANEIKAANTQH